jgi:hypothetical protein
MHPVPCTLLVVCTLEFPRVRGEIEKVLLVSESGRIGVFEGGYRMKTILIKLTE